MSKYSSWYDATLQAESLAIGQLKQKLDYAVMDKIVNLLLTVKPKKRRVTVIGCGTSGIAGRRIAHLLSCIEVPSIFLTPSEALHGALGFVQKDDIAILIAKGGNTSEVVSCIPALRGKGAVMIAVTHNVSSIIAKQANITLLIETGEEPCPFKLLPCASTLGVMAAWDAITLTLMRLSSFTKENFLAIHPGGATGDILRKDLEYPSDSAQQEQK